MTIDRTHHTIDHGALLGEARFEEIILLVDARLHDAAHERLTTDATRSLRDRVGVVLVSLGTAIAGERGQIAAPRSPLPKASGGPGLASAGDRS